MNQESSAESISKTGRVASRALVGVLLAATVCSVAFGSDTQVATEAAKAVQEAKPLLSAENGVAFLTLTAMEIVLGIDNIVFIAILCGKLPKQEQEKARIFGLALAMFTRVGLLFTIKWIMGLTKKSLFVMPIIGHEVNGRDLVLLLGGLFLIYKATKEIYHKVEGAAEEHNAATVPTAGVESAASTAAPASSSVTTKRAGAAKFWPTIWQILIIDIVFSLDSIITAVGMAQNIWVMAAAVVVAVLVMLVISGKIAAFIERHPSIKMLALSFLMLIGVMLVADSMGQHIPKGYIYTAMAFSLSVEMLNLWRRKKQEPTPKAPHAAG
ncbi:MAG: TerC family protein [Phycisphaerales bacterium]